MNGLTFDADTHTYRYNGNVVPGVTSILAPLTDFGSVPTHVLQAASDFGTAVHYACELDDLGELDEGQLDAALAPYLEGWRKFSKDYAVVWSLIEQRVYHKSMGYAGTLDRMGMVKGLSTVVDIKSSAQLYPAVGPQLAAYQQATPVTPQQRMAVQLKANGTYVVKVYTDPTDWPLFASLLTLHTWCARHSITPNFKD